jgi:2,4-dienoyl-CoA reductase-like NADH-dependent reductase (Old Yellow Enzyme family)/thioredoxin reductase
MYEHLFSPFELRGLLLKNRIVMPPMGVFLVEPGGLITDRTVAYYRRRARGGAAMVMVEACAVAPEGIVSHTQMRIDGDEYIGGLSRIAEAIKEEGARAAIQIHHAGRQTSTKVIGRRPLAPSPLPCPTIKGEVEPLDLEGIRRLIRLFGDAAQRAMEAGFELIEVHGAHGYLINQFLSPFSNIRQDEYGGDTEGRTRFAIEVVKEIRRRIGEGVPVSFKISAQEFVPNGLTVDESIKIIKLLADAGVDAVQVSAGTDATPEWISQPMLMPRGCLVDSAHRIREAVEIPVICVGRINGPELAEEILSQGKADLICMGRALLADPDLPRKAMEGREVEIRRCIACNTCINSIFKKGRVECLVNPEVGREKEMQINPIRKKRRYIMVIGGGPAGAEASWVAASRGHKVELFEAGDALGGQIILGAVPPHKRELLNIVDFHEHQLKRHGVQIHLGHHVKVEDVLKAGPDVVVLATGAKPYIPPALEGIKRGVTTYAVALNGTEGYPRDVLVVGGGPVGCELALYLSQKGLRVTIMEMMDRIGAQYEAMTRKLVVREIHKRGIRVITGCKMTGFDGKILSFERQDGEKGQMEVELVVVATGATPEDSLYMPLRMEGLEVHKVGDCVEPRSIKEAIYEGAALARSL